MRNNGRDRYDGAVVVTVGRGAVTVTHLRQMTPLSLCFSSNSNDKRPRQRAPTGRCNRQRQGLPSIHLSPPIIVGYPTTTRDSKTTRMVSRTTTQRIRHAFLVLLLLGCCCGMVVDASSTTSSAATSSSSSYVSVRALDKFGHSEQLTHALKAANLQGTLVVAAHDTANNCTLVLSVLDTTATSASARVMPKIPRMMHLIHQKPPAFMTTSTNSIQTAVVCTGIKGDANWLIQQLQAYSHRVWTRYNTFVGTSGIALATSKYMRQFWKYDPDDEYLPGRLIRDDDHKDPSFQWGRPLGVVAMIVSAHVPYIFVVEPSGVMQRYTAFAMGKHSSNALEHLGQALDPSSSSSASSSKMTFRSPNLQGRLVEVLQSAVPSNPKKELNILVEILSKDGVKRTVLSVR